jgi:hypothetical protein
MLFKKSARRAGGTTTLSEKTIIGGWPERKDCEPGAQETCRPSKGEDSMKEARRVGWVDRLIAGGPETSPKRISDISAFPREFRAWPS